MFGTRLRFLATASDVNAHLSVLKVDGSIPKVDRQWSGNDDSGFNFLTMVRRMPRKLEGMHHGRSYLNPRSMQHSGQKPLSIAQNAIICLHAFGSKYG